MRVDPRVERDGHGAVELTEVDADGRPDIVVEQSARTLTTEGVCATDATKGLAVP
jgi:hypothetical protein